MSPSTRGRGELRCLFSANFLLQFCPCVPSRCLHCWSCHSKNPNWRANYRLEIAINQYNERPMFSCNSIPNKNFDALERIILAALFHHIGGIISSSLDLVTSYEMLQNKPQTGCQSFCFVTETFKVIDQKSCKRSNYYWVSNFQFKSV